LDYTVKEISEKTNLKPYVLRYYEKEGLLPHVRRTKGGVRRYTDEDLEWVGLICCLKNTGMSIKQIREFVSLSLQGPKTLARRCELLENHKRDVAANILQMRRHLEIVTCKIAHFTKQREEYQARKKP
jgi:DNA-binding transcriptional MerR regulator